MSSEVDFSVLADKSPGYSGADIANVCRDASMMGIRRLLEEAREKRLSAEQTQAFLQAKQVEAGSTCVTQDDLLRSLSQVSKSVGDKDIGRFEAWMNEFGSS